MKDFQLLKTLAEEQIGRTLGSFPPELQVVIDIPIILEKIPALQDQADGVFIDVLGLFVGPTLAEMGSGSSDEPPHILLYLENIWNEAEKDADIFCREVEITLLHELGHYLNWNETDLEERGLG